MSPKSRNYIITNEKVFSREEMQRLFDTCHQYAARDLAHRRKTWPVRSFLVWFIFHTGLRVGELAQLRIGDINADKQFLVIVGKGRKKREVPFNQATRLKLEAYLGYKKTQLQQSIQPDACLFASRNGRPYTTRSLEISFKKAVQAAGLSAHYYIHCARHTHATFLLKHTGNLRFVQKVLGHASIHTTSLYADILAEDTVRLANMLEFGAPETAS